MIRLGIVVPCFNEVEVIDDTVEKLTGVLADLVEKGKISGDSRLVFVDDGSRDSTWERIEAFSAADERINGVKLSRNVGHQRALLAGLLSRDEDALVSIDADLQDDIDAIEKMVDAHLDGAEVVYGVRDNRETDTPFKRGTANMFYRTMRALGADVIQEHADFRLMGRRSLDALGEYREANLFLRGLIPMIGYPSRKVYYRRGERTAGESKYPLRKMLSLALDGLTSLSSFPLRLITFIGLVVFLIATAMSAWTLAVVLFTDQAVPGWASTVLPMYFIGGVQILCIGVLGEYAGKIYQEVKQRPRYFIERTSGQGHDAK